MKVCVIACLLFAAAITANAGVITGDNVTLTFSPTGGSSVATTGAGFDLEFGNFHFDFNRGASADEFLFTSTPEAGFLGGSTSFTVSSLLFAGGELLTGFSLYETSLANFSFSTTASSITFNYLDADGYASAGTVISGRYLTSNPNNAVPEPASTLLMLVGLMGLGISRWRSKQITGR